MKISEEFKLEKNSLEREIAILSLAKWNLGGGERAEIIGKWIEDDEKRLKSINIKIENDEKRLKLINIKQ